MENIGVTDKKTLHKTLNGMLKFLPKDIKILEIHICNSLLKFDNELKEKMMFKGIKIYGYDEWFANGKIIMTPYENTKLIEYYKNYKT